MLDQFVKLEDNRELVQDQALKHEDSRELRYQYDKNMETISVDWTTIFTANTDHSLLRFNIDNLHDKILVPESGIYLANVPPKFRTVLKVEKYIHPGGVGYITSIERFLVSYASDILSLSIM